MAKNKGGRPPKYDKISKRDFELLCNVQCTRDEICATLNVDANTLSKWIAATYDGASFSTIFKQKRNAGFASLRKRTYSAGMEGNTAILIFLNKVWLGLNEKVEVQVEKKDEIVIDMTPPEVMD